MNRQLNFRAWHLDDGMLYFDFDTMVKGYHDQYGNIMQYTGCKDKNKNPIYEGDIVKQLFPNLEYDEKDNPNVPKFIEKVSLIEYRHHGFWVKNEYFGWEGEGIWYWDAMEVIGNIFENPELLKQQENATNNH